MRRRRDTGALATAKRPAFTQGINGVADASLWAWGDTNWPAFRIVAQKKTSTGAIVQVANACSGNPGVDTKQAAFYCRRRDPVTLLWGAITKVYDPGPGPTATPATAPRISNQVILVDSLPADGKDTIYVHFVSGASKLMQDAATAATMVLKTIWSRDDGLHWGSNGSTANDNAPVALQDGVNPLISAAQQTAWSQVHLGPGEGIQLKYGTHVGRLMCFGDHKKGGSPGWAHGYYCDDHSTTPDPTKWKFFAICDDTVSDNLTDQSIETQGVEMVVADAANGVSAGDIYVQCRNILNGRTFLRSKTSGDSWGTNGACNDGKALADAALTGPSCQGGMTRYDAGNVILTYPRTGANSADRRELVCRYGNTFTWSTPVVIWPNYAGYSSVCVDAKKNILIAFEAGTFDMGTGFTSDQYEQEIILRTINMATLKQPAANIVAEWHFNERANAKTLLPAVQQTAPLREYGRYGSRANTTVAGTPANFLYVLDGGIPNQSAIGLYHDTADQYIKLADAKSELFQFDANTFWTIELQRTLNITQTGVLFSLGNTGAAPYVVLAVDAAGIPTLSVADDAGHSGALVGSVALPGNKCRVVIRRGVGSDLTKFDLTVNNNATETMTVTGCGRVTAADPAMARIGVDSALANPFAGTISLARLTKGTTATAVLPIAATLPVTTVKTAPPALGAMTTSPPLTALGAGANKFYCPSPYDVVKANGAYSTRYLVNQLGGLQARQAVRSILTPDAAQSFLRATSSANDCRYALTDYDSVMGWHWRHDCLTPDRNLAGNANANGLTVVGSKAAQTFDFIHQTGIFTLAFMLRHTSDIGTAAQYIFDNRNGGANPGFFLQVVADGANYHILDLNIRNGTNVRITTPTYDAPHTPLLWEYHSVANAANDGNLWTAFFLVCTGTGQPIKQWRLNVDPAQSIPAFVPVAPTASSSQTLDTTNGTVNDASVPVADLAIGMRADSDSNGDAGGAAICIKEPMFFNIAGVGGSGGNLDTLYQYYKGAVAREV